MNVILKLARRRHHCRIYGIYHILLPLICIGYIQTFRNPIVFFLCQPIFRHCIIGKLRKWLKIVADYFNIEIFFRLKQFEFEYYVFDEELFPVFFQCHDRSEVNKHSRYIVLVLPDRPFDSCKTIWFFWEITTLSFRGIISGTTIL